MAKGKKTGGRKKGTPNRVTGEVRELFKRMFEGMAPDVERWIRETGNGFQAVHILSDGTKVPIVEKNPGKAADLLLRLAEFHIPKLARTEHANADGSKLEGLTLIIGKPKDESAPE